MPKLPKSAIYTAIPVYLTTTVVWVVGVSNHTFLASEFWLYVGIFLIPAFLVCVSSWLIFHHKIWCRAAGLIMVLPAAALWVISLLLVYGGFKIH